jgi:hypothetical protein
VEDELAARVASIERARARLPCYDVCGSDIGRLYEDRGISLHHAPYFDRDLEYAPVIGIVMYTAGAPAGDGLRGKFLVNALVLTGLAAVTTWVLWRRYGKRAVRWALAAPLVVSGLTNWDLLAVAPATIALLQWDANRVLLAGVLIGIGASAKLFPLLFIPMMVASCVPARQWRRARRLAVGSVIGLAIGALPLYLAEPHALRYFLRFHSIRGRRAARSGTTSSATRRWTSGCHATSWSTSSTS